MQYFADSFLEAIKMLISLDPELYGIIFLSLKISAVAVLISSLIGMPLAGSIALHEFRGKTLVINIVNTLMGLPPVVVGLVVYILLSNQFGLFGPLRLLFTPFAMIIAQVILATPIVTGLSMVAISGIDPLVGQTALSLGATKKQMTSTIMREARYAIGAAVIAGFGRLMAEVGAVMMVGGNVRYRTRVMTTAIAMNKGMGEFVIALSLGVILLLLSFLSTILLDKMRRLGVKAE